MSEHLYIGSSDPYVILPLRHELCLLLVTERGWVCNIREMGTILNSTTFPPANFGMVIQEHERVMTIRGLSSEIPAMVLRSLLAVLIGMISMAGAPCVATCQDLAAVVESVPKASESLAPGNHWRKLSVGKLVRIALVHVPVDYKSDEPTPVVLALHGVAMSGPIMAAFSGLNEISDQKGFVVVYPNGTGSGPILTWNAGGFVKGIASQADDVAFLRQLLDDLATVVNVDSKRIYACGMSNGAMMCYRLASEMSDRIAAIAPVAGTMPADSGAPDRPVPVIHFHGTCDTLVPFEAKGIKQQPWLRLKSVEDSVRAWVQFNGCDAQPSAVDLLSKEGDELKVTRQRYGPGTEGAEVVLVTISDGGHTWPGQVPPVDLLGKSAMNISANELIWAFFAKHPLK